MSSLQIVTNTFILLHVTLTLVGKSRETLLDKEKMSRKDDRVTFNINILCLKNIRIIFKKFNILLASEEQHRKVLTDIPRIGFKNGESLKDHLV